MDAIRHLFFEDPSHVYVAMALAWVVLLIVWLRRRGDADAWRLLIPPVLAGAAFALAAMVVTDREYIDRAARDVSAGFEKGDFPAILKHLDDRFVANFTGSMLVKRDVQAAARLEKEKWNIGRIYFTDVKIEFAGTRATMHLTTLIEGNWQGVSARNVLTWKVLWIKRQKTWLILEVFPLVQAEWPLQNG